MYTPWTDAARISSPESRECRRQSNLLPRICGRTVFELYDAFWRSHGIQNIYLGTSATIDPEAGLYVLQDDSLLTLPNLAAHGNGSAWMGLRYPRRRTSIACVRIEDSRGTGYRERCVVDDDEHFVRFERHYDSRVALQHRLGVTRSARLARIWQQHSDAADAWREIRRQSKKEDRSVVRANVSLFNWMNPEDVTAFAVELVHRWEKPGLAIPELVERRQGVWSTSSESLDPQARVIGPAWIGANRYVSPDDCLIGPAVLWDRKETPLIPDYGPADSSLAAEVEEPSGISSGRPLKAARARLGYTLAKRTFDICFSLIALLITVPFYPIIFLAIWLEDGRPFFFAHRREGKKGRDFGCLKFRSMRKDAEETRRKILAQNHCDGPQFYIESDPRLTRVGRLLRDLQIDEWPQFWLVLSGAMSVVGPRPLPKAENQCCPAWREARLGVPPGITGLWQVKRSRRHGLDFQEWIRYDVEYVENASFGLDMYIVWQSFAHLFRMLLGSGRRKAKKAPLAVHDDRAPASLSRDPIGGPSTHGA